MTLVLPHNEINTHIAIVIMSITGPNFPRQHTRRYIQRTPDYASGLPPRNQNSNANWPATNLFNNAADPDIDAIAELVFGDEAGCKKFFEIIKEDDAQRKLASDEELFLDRGKLKVVALNAIITNSMPFPGEQGLE